MAKRPKATARSYVTAKDITIPAGTRVIRASWTTQKPDFAQAIIGPTKDTHFEWSMAFEDAVATGLVCEE